MSSLSPASVLFDINGTTLAVYNNTAGVANQPLLPIAGYDGYTNVTRYLLVNAQGSQLAALASNNVNVLSNATITTAGSDIFSVNYFGSQQINIIVNVLNAPTGTGTPTLTFTIQEVDPGNGVTTFGNSASTTGITAAGVYTAVLTNTHSSAVEVSWTISGTTPSFTGVYVTITTKATPDTQLVSGTVTATNASVGTDGGASLTSDTQVGGIVATNAPTFTSGNLNALSLTTKGGLRIDGVFPTGAAVPVSDAMYMGAAVTTSAPSYTTGQMNALSLTTSGLLRIDGVYPINTTTPTTDAVFVAGAVTTTAPTYTTGQMSALSLTTLGQLRVDGVYAVATANSTATDVGNVGGYVTTAAPTYTTAQINPLSLDTSGNLRVLANQPTAANLNATIVGSGSAGTAATGVVTVQGISGMTPISVTSNKSSTSNVTSVTGATSSTAILAANANRIAASIYNNTNKNMYVLCNSGTASTSNFTILLMQGSYWEVPSDYTGAINAIWANGVSGSALVTEFTS